MMERRDFLKLAGLPALSWIPGCATTPWERLSEKLGGRLIRPESHVKPCLIDAKSSACAEALRNAANPFWLEEQPGATQTTGWAGAWESTPSPYAVAAESTDDVVAAVDFARRNRVRLVIKGTGHDYLGRSCAPDSLLIWTHRMRKTEMHDAFVPEGGTGPGVPAISVQAGTRWIEAYTEVTTKNGRYVQGGGCASVGAAGGFIQGGGFGSFSKKFGTGAAGVLEFEVVVADGRVLIANAHRNADLFWALRGGGGATFGVVTRVTLATHPLPEKTGIVRGKIAASSDGEYRGLVEQFARFFVEKLNNEHWGEQFSFNPDNTINLFLTFQGLDPDEVAALFAPWKGLQTIVVPSRDLWNPEWWTKTQPDLVHPDPTMPGRYWWEPNSAEVSKYWYTYQSRWIPARIFGDPELLFRASRHWSLSFNVNKGLAGASEDAVRRTRDTSMNPVVFDAAALVILSAGERGVFPQVGGKKPDLAKAREQVARVNAAMKLLRDATPETGAYANEADFFEPDWQKQFWGVNYPRLLEIKRKYDPDGLFRHHHCVGSGRS